MFVANREDNNVSVIDLVTLKELIKIKVEKAPFGVFTAESNKYIFVTNVQSNSISLIDKKNLKLEKNIKVGSWPYQVAFDNINKRAFDFPQSKKFMLLLFVKEFI